MELKIEAINPSPHPSVIGLTGEYLIIFINTLHIPGTVQKLDVNVQHTTVIRIEL